MTFYTKITIDGTDVSTNVLSYEVEDTIKNNATTGEIILALDAYDSIDVTANMSVVITRGSVTSTDSTIFQGSINEITKEAGSIICNIVDKINTLQVRTVNTSYDKNIDSQAGVISAIAQDLIETHAGLTASVENTGTVNVIEKFICRHDIIFERLKRLAELVDYQIYYNPSTDTIHFESKGKTSYDTTLLVNNNSNVVNVPRWLYNNDEIANFIRIGGASDTIETTQTFSGDDAETEFTLTKEPFSVKVFIGGTLKTGGVVGSSETYDYYIDTLNKKIIFLSAPAAGSDNIEVRYSYKEARLILVKDDDSIASFGKKELTKNYDDIEDVEDARERGMKLLSKRKNPFVSTSLDVAGAENLTAGMKVTVNDTYSSENRTLTVKKVLWQYPAEIIEVDVGDEDFDETVLMTNINERLRRLERESMRTTDIVDQTFLLNRSINYGRRYAKLNKKSIDDTTFLIWDHPSQGNWDEEKWGNDADSPFGTETTERLIWPNNVYIERFKDETFNGSGTGVWNTTSKRLEL